MTTFRDIVRAGRLANRPVRSLSGATITYVDGTTGTAADLAAELATVRRSDARRAALSAIDGMAFEVAADYPLAEKLGWAAKLAQAQAYAATGDEADAPDVRDEATIRGTTTADLVTLITTTAETTSVLAAVAAGMRAQLDADLDASDGSPTELDAIVADVRTRCAAVAAVAGDRAAMVAAATPG